MTISAVICNSKHEPLALTNGKCRNNLRIRVLSLDTLSARPLLDILNENITILNSELKTRNYIDLSKEQITMPRSGIFVVLELLYPETECDKHSYTSISATLSVEKDLVWFNYRDRKWSHNTRPRLPNGDYMTPNVSVSLGY